MSIVQLFVLPKRLDLETYGHYRFFLVYVSYLGVLSFGIVDGAFVRWAGRTPTVIAREWWIVGRWLFASQAAVLAAAVVIASITTQPLTRTFILALGACSVFVNAVALSSYALQAAGDFRGSGGMMALAPSIFIASVLIIPMRSLAAVLATYVLSYSAAAFFGAIRVARMSSSSPSPILPDRPPLLATLAVGLPVLGATVAAILSQSTDRIILSVATPIASFALYGFASTVTVAANTATQALARVALSHAARQPDTERARFLGSFYSVIAAAYGVALVAEPTFEYMVSTRLPVYAAALPIVRALTLGLPFWVATHVVLIPTLQSHGFVRRQLVLELAGVALVLIACGIALTQHAPLWGIAGAASAAAVASFTVGVAFVRRVINSSSIVDGARFVIVTSWQGASLMMALRYTPSVVAQTLVAMALLALPTQWSAMQAQKRGW